MPLIDHAFKTGPTLPPMPGCLFQYLVGSNGVFCRAERPELWATVPLSAAPGSIRGLSPVKPSVLLWSSRVPSDLVLKMVLKARQVGPREILFYLIPPNRDHNWQLAMPAQHISAGSVYPLDPYNAWGNQALIEVHSHHNMAAFFSGTDNRDESSGFRLYGVLGEVNTRPVIRMRVGIYGHFMTIPAAHIIEMPYGLRDGAAEHSYESEITTEDEYAGYLAELAA